MRISLSTKLGNINNNLAGTHAPIDPVLQFSPSGIQSSGTDVTAWNDDIGTNTLDIASGTPQLVAAGLNGNDYVSFDDAFLKKTSYTGLPTGNSDRSMISVVRYRSAGWGGFAYGTSGSRNTSGLAITSSGVLAAQFWEVDLVSTIQMSASWIVQAFIKQDDNVRLYQNDQVIQTGNRIINTPTVGNIIVGVEIDETPLVDMDVAEMLVYTGNLTIGSLENKISQLMTTYGIT